MPRDFSAPMIAWEIENLKAVKAPIQNLTWAIQAREKCLDDLQKSNQLIEEALNEDLFDEDGGLLVKGFNVEEEFMEFCSE